MPWVRITFDDAKKVASMMQDTEVVKSHLTFGAEYDSVLEWLIKTEVKTRVGIAEDSSRWGNYWETAHSPRDLVETGHREQWCENNIYDFAGNVSEWTQEQNESSYRVFRGGSYWTSKPVAYRDYCVPEDERWSIGFRVTLYIK